MMLDSKSKKLVSNGEFFLGVPQGSRCPLYLYFLYQENKGCRFHHSHNVRCKTHLVIQLELKMI